MNRYVTCIQEKCNPSWSLNLVQEQNSNILQKYTFYIIYNNIYKNIQFYNIQKYTILQKYTSSHLDKNERSLCPFPFENEHSSLCGILNPANFNCL